jgi:hypothetical protein
MGHHYYLQVTKGGFRNLQQYDKGACGCNQLNNSWAFKNNEDKNMLDFLRA